MGDVLTVAVILNPALNAPECVAAARADKAPGGRRIATCHDEQRSRHALQSCNRVSRILGGLTEKMRLRMGGKR